MGVVAATVTTIVVPATALGSLGCSWSIERGGLVGSVLLLVHRYSSVLTIAVLWRRGSRLRTSLCFGLAVTTAGFRRFRSRGVAVAAGRVRVAVLGAAPFAVSGSAHVVLRWSVWPWTSRVPVDGVPVGRGWQTLST